MDEVVMLINAANDAGWRKGTEEVFGIQVGASLCEQTNQFRFYMKVDNCEACCRKC